MMTTIRWRKKPVEIEAVRLTLDNSAAVAQWCGGSFIEGADPNGDPFRCVLIRTLEGKMRADVGDYVIRGIRGEHYPCKAEIFEASYERVGPVYGKPA